jgi:hypothetical protein
MSTIVTDTITGKSTATTVTIGSTPVVSASANSMTIRGEGSNQTSIQQGLCKWWIKYNQDTPATEDSFNVSSLSDEEAGKSKPVYTNNMSSANYCVSIIHQAEVTNTGSTEYTVSQATNTTELRTVENSSLRDKGNAAAFAVGDLS